MLTWLMVISMLKMERDYGSLVEDELVIKRP